MKTILFFTLLFPFYLWAQEDPKEKLDSLTIEIKIMVKTEKEMLKEKLQTIEKQLEAGEIDQAKADELKKEISVESAKKISAIVTERTEEMKEITKEIVVHALENDSDVDTLPNKRHQIAIDIKKKKKSEDDYRRTENRLVFAFGLNNVITNGNIQSLDDSLYDIWNSNFIELGWGYKTAFSKESSLVNLAYGVSFQWNELKLFNNQFHVDAGDYTQIITHSEDLKKSKLRNTSIIVPVGLEFDFSGKKEVDGKMIPVRNKSVKIGFGGYAGLRINTKQIIKYNSPREQKKEKISAGYNTNNLLYGLMGSIGYQDTSLYIKYDLHPLFKNTETQNVSLGVRFDL